MTPSTAKPIGLPTLHRCETASGHGIRWTASGTGSPAVLVAGGWVTHVSLDWTHGAVGVFHRRLTRRRRVIRFDMPGTGLSDHLSGPLSLGDCVEVFDAVAEAAGETAMTVLAYGLSVPAAVAFAARRPSRVGRLILIDGAGPSGTDGRNHHSRALTAAGALMQIDQHLGVTTMTELLAGDANPTQAAWYSNHQSLCATRLGATRLLESLRTHDATALVAGVSSPAIVLRPRRAVLATRPRSRLADLLPQARVVELQARDIVPFFGLADQVVDELEAVGPRGAALTRRELAVLTQAGSGLTNRAIGTRLGITENTAARHLANLSRKLGVSSRCAAVRRAQQLGLLPTTAHEREPVAPAG